MKRMLTMVFISVALSVGLTLFATWISMTVRTARHGRIEPDIEAPTA